MKEHAISTRAWRSWPHIALLAALFVGALASGVGVAHALDSARSLRQLHHKAWTAKEGAPSQISALAQTSDGFLWIGSARGLFRFDGELFEQFVPPDGARLPSYNIYALLSTPEGGLWISFRPSGLGLFQDGVFTAFTRPDELPKSQVYTFACDLDGRIWAGTHTGLVLRDGTRWIDVGMNWDLPPSRIFSLFVDHGGTLWVATGTKLYTLQRGAARFVDAGECPMAIQRIVQSGDGTIWLGADGGPRARDDAASSGAALESDSFPWLTDFLLDRDGCMWIATFGDGLKRGRSLADFRTVPPQREDSRLESFSEADELSGALTYRLLEDREGSIWVGTAKGLDRFRHSHLVPIFLPPGHQSLILSAEPRGVVRAIGASGMPLVRIDGETVTLARFRQRISSMYRDPHGVVWWGGESIWREEAGEFRRIAFHPDAPSDWMWEVFPSDKSGGLWISVGDIGLRELKDGRWTNRRPPASLPARGPSASLALPDGRVWLGYTENRACLLSGSDVRSFSEDDGLEIGRIRVIRGKGPAYWFGGELGLSAFTGDRFQTVRPGGGESFGTVSGVIETADGGLWLNELRGIVHIPAEEMTAALEDSSHEIQIERFDYQDGLPGAGQMNWTSSTAVEGTDGRLWFATDNGLATIDPLTITRNELPPPVSIRSIRTNQSTYPASDALRLPVGTSSLRIDYTALSLAIPERVRYRVKLDGYDEQWRDAGPQRAAFYTGVRPGHYRFHVVACNNDGVWNNFGATTHFSIAPAFHQTAWFMLLMALSGAAGLWLLYLARVRQVSANVRKLHDERTAERMRIANDLHDTLLQGFLSASMQLHVIASSLHESPAGPKVRHVLGLMGGVIDEARDTLRGLRTVEPAPAMELEQAFARITHESGLAPSRDLRVAVIGRPLPLQPLIRDEVYRIGRESVLNALRHSGGEEIDVELHYLSKQLRLIVRDNGRGIDPDVVASGRDGHWGLLGMRERAERIGGGLEVRSSPGRGTEVELSLPGSIAYARTRQTTWLDRASSLWRTIRGSRRPIDSSGWE